MSKRENEADGGQLDPQGNHLSPKTQIVQRSICVNHELKWLENKITFNWAALGCASVKNGGKIIL